MTLGKSGKRNLNVQRLDHLYRVTERTSVITPQGLGASWGSARVELLRETAIISDGSSASAARSRNCSPIRIMQAL